MLLFWKSPSKTYSLPLRKNGERLFAVAKVRVANMATLTREISRPRLEI